VKKLKQTFRIGLFGIIFSLTVFSAPVFSAGEGILSVRAMIPGRLSQNVLQQQRILKITEEDVSRGYIDISAGTILQVNTNALNGYYLHVGMQEVVIEKVRVTINGREVMVPLGGGLVHQPLPETKHETLQIGYRLFFKNGITPGTYVWPVSIVVSLF